jgi:hypothetical protein
LKNLEKTDILICLPIFSFIVVEQQFFPYSSESVKISGASEKILSLLLQMIQKFVKYPTIYALALPKRYQFPVQ